VPGEGLAYTVIPTVPRAAAGVVAVCGREGREGRRVKKAMIEENWMFIQF